MTIWQMAAAAACIAVVYFILGVFAPPLAAAMVVGGAAMAVLLLGGLFVQCYNIMRAIDGIRRDLAEWMRDPKAPNPADSYLSRIARALAAPK